MFEHFHSYYTVCEEYALDIVEVIKLCVMKKCWLLSVFSSQFNEVFHWSVNRTWKCHHTIKKT